MEVVDWISPWLVTVAVVPALIAVPTAVIVPEFTTDLLPLPLMLMAAPARLWMKPSTMMVAAPVVITAEGALFPRTVPVAPTRSSPPEAMLMTLQPPSDCSTSPSMMILCPVCPALAVITRLNSVAR